MLSIFLSRSSMYFASMSDTPSITGTVLSEHPVTRYVRDLPVHLG